MIVRFTLGKKTLDLVVADITTLEVDAIVNAANAQLDGGGGVDGAIHRAAGPSVMEECRRIGGCPTGSAAPTTAGALKARWIFHAVGPIWQGGTAGEAQHLRAAYQACLDHADLKRCRTLAFPALSTGVYAYPMRQAADVALATIVTHLKGRTQVERVIFALFDEKAHAVFAEALTALAAARGFPPPANLD